MILTRLPRKLALRLRSEIAVRDQMAIDELRTSIEREKANAHLRPNVERVLTIVSDIMSITDLTSTAKAMGLDDEKVATNMVLDVVAAFGTWIGHSIGTTETQMVNASIFEQLPLMQMPHAIEVPGTPEKKTGRAKETKRIPVVILPDGYEPTAEHGRDVTKALSLIVMNHPSNEMVTRFVSRTYATRSATLTYPVIAGVWDFAVRGRLHKIKKVSDDLVFHELVVEAYDLLEVSRRDAVESLARLAQPETPSDELHRLVVLSRWLAPNEVARIERSLQMGDETNVELRREQLALAARIDADPLNFAPESIAELNLGQVLRISQAAGVAVEENRSLEIAVRSELKALGLHTDTDRLLPEALRAASRGKLDDFWAVLRARVDGDLTWSSQLEELLNDDAE